MMPDSLQPFLFKHTAIRGKIIRLNQTLATILKQHHYPFEIAELLSHTLCASGLLSSTLKYMGQLTLQFQSKGPLSMLVAKCDHEGHLRGTARWDDSCDNGDYIHNFEEGELVVTIQNQKNQNRHQSIVQINHQSIAHALESYFMQSEQLETRFWLGYDKDSEEAVGLLLQKLPSTHDNHHQYSEDEDWQHILTLANTLQKHELLHWNNEELLSKLFYEETIDLFEPQKLSFHCPCNAQKMFNAIQVLGEAEANKILNTHRYIEVTCEYCNEHFEFNEREIKRLFTQH